MGNTINFKLNLTNLDIGKDVKKYNGTVGSVINYKLINGNNLINSDNYDCESQYATIDVLDSATNFDSVDSTVGAGGSTIDVVDQIGDVSGTVLSTGAMAVGGVLNGVGNFGETLVDATAIVGTVAETPFTAVYDFFTGSNTTEEMWANTQAFTSTEYVNNAFEDFYTNNDVGKMINDNAWDQLQYGSAGYNIGVGVGYVGATIATAGVVSAISGVGMGVTGASISGVSGFGRGSSEAYSNGATTEEGLAAGALTGAWEAGQWALGAKVSGQGMKTVAVDFASGLADMPVRSGIQAIYSDKSYGEIFESNGGVTGMVANGLLAAGLAVAGEKMSGNKLFVQEKTSGVDNLDTTTITLKSTSSEYSDEQIVCKVIPNEEISNYIENIPDERKFVAAKTASVSARTGIEGETIHTELKTVYNGKQYILSEENNVVKVRETSSGSLLPDVVVTNINSTSNEQYIVKAEKFASTYEVQGDGLFVPVLEPREMAQVSENVVIMTSWGEPAVCLKDSYIVTYDASKNDFNTIEKAAYESTYSIVSKTD